MSRQAGAGSVSASSSVTRSLCDLCGHSSSLDGVFREQRRTQGLCNETNGFFLSRLSLSCFQSQLPCDFNLECQAPDIYMNMSPYPLRRVEGGFCETVPLGCRQAVDTFPHRR